MAKKIKVGVVGATGMVGKSFMETLAQRSFPVEELRPFASENSVGKKISLNGKEWPIQALKPGCFKGLDVVFFSSGDEISLEWAPIAVSEGAWVVDNSGAFRMDSSKLLIVPEINGDLLKNQKTPQIIANPNCTVIQLVMAMKPLYDNFGIEEVKISSYQAVSGAGQPAYDELLAQMKAYQENKPIEVRNQPHQILFNCIPQIGGFESNGYSREELKVHFEAKKIMNDKNIKVSVTTVRVPVLNAHAESVWIKLKKDTTRQNIIDVLSNFPGVVVQDDVQKSIYPLQSKASGKDEVFVGRIRQDLEDPKTWLMWIVSDNVRKGAALNGLQIAERIFDIG